MNTLSQESDAVSKLVLLFIAEFLEMIILDKATMNSTTNWTKPDCHCLPGCNEVSYSSSMTYGNLEPTFVMNKEYLNQTKGLDRTDVR